MKCAAVDIFKQYKQTLLYPYHGMKPVRVYADLHAITYRNWSFELARKCCFLAVQLPSFHLITTD